MFNVWFWQTINTPHMAYLASALAKLGCEVTYVAGCEMTLDRAELGWSVPLVENIEIFYVKRSSDVNSLVHKAPTTSIHICQGLRANGCVSWARRALASRGMQQWIIMETVADAGFLGLIKRLIYKFIIKRQRDSLAGILAIGHRTADWLVARGMPTPKVYPFAYFLPCSQIEVISRDRKLSPFRFVFAGRLIPLKRVDWLINALEYSSDQDFELWIIGSGPEESSLRLLASQKLGNRVRWFGLLPSQEVSQILAEADCLVLPSHHDGWGAVVSEALAVGTPVICSDACGSAGVVHASGFGRVFHSDNETELRAKLNEQILLGPLGVTERGRLASWATALGTEAGARYLLSILESNINGGLRATPPWQGKDLNSCVE